MTTIVCLRIMFLLFILTANGVLPGGSGNIIRHNKQITPRSNETQHTKLHTQDSVSMCKLILHGIYNSRR
jgi:hypothetical protein